VPVADHRARPLDALRQLGHARTQPREEPEGAVDVQPGVVAFRERRHVRDRIEIARVHLAGVADQERRRAA
jgi:hypothetical protein